MENRISVEIFNRKYTIRTTEKKEYIIKIADYIDKSMKKIYESDHRFDLAMVSTLTSINITDEYFKSLETADNLRKQMTSYINELSEARDEIKQLKIKLASAANSKTQKGNNGK